MGLVVPGEEIKIEKPLDKVSFKDKLKGFFKKTGEKIKGLPWYGKVGLALGLVVVMGGLVWVVARAKGGDETADENNTPENIDDLTVEFDDQTYFESPINGTLIHLDDTEELFDRRPLCVMIENHPDARPQYGFSKADLVYEALAEGGITRMMAIFWSQDAEKLMPIRSARYYYVIWTTDFGDCVYYHIGEAASSDPVVNVRSVVNEYDVTEIRDRLFDRDQECDAVKNTEHCAYTSTERLWTEAEEEGYVGGIGEVQKYQFKNETTEDPSMAEGTRDYSGQKYQIGFRLSAHYKVDQYKIVWEYSPDDNSYTRYHGVFDDKDVLEDGLTDEPIKAKNIAIMKTYVRAAHDWHNRNKIDVIGSGDALVLRDGKVIEGTWKKESGSDRTKFYDKAGNEVVFNRGQIWIEAVPDDLQVEFKFEDDSQIDI